MDYYEDLIVLNYGKLILVGVASFVILNCELPMASASFIVFFLLSHFASLVIFVGSCPPDSFFPCGKIRLPISFPFTSTEFPGCGLVMLNCTDEPFPTIQLKENGQRYDVTQIIPEDPQSGHIKIRDQELGKQLDNRSCETFHNLTFPSSPSISYSLPPPRLNLLKCNTTPDLKQIDADFNPTNYSSYKKCPGHSIFYIHPNLNQSMPSGNFADEMPFENLPHKCSLIQLPMRKDLVNEDSDDLFTLLTAEFSLGYRVSRACQECRSNGSQCSNGSKGEVHCIYLKKENHKSRRVVILATGIPAALIGLVVIIFYCLKRKFFWKKGMQNDQSVEVFLQNYGSLAPKRYSYSDIKKMTFSFKDKLGQGGYGGVYKGKLHDGCLVAVKVLNESKGDGEEFINEVASICRTSHVNIVTLLGFCFEGSKRALIYEFMPKGSLEKFIYENPLRKNRQLEWETLYQIAIGIARGLEYLHRGCKTRILHFDIKPHNILLDEDFCPKISDFGLAKLCPKKESIISMLGARGTAGYIAPEVFSRNFGGVSHKSDVYSYGMMVLEMVGGRKNIDVSVDNDSEIYFPHWIFKRLEQGHDQLGLHGVMNEEENEKARKMILVGLWSIQTDPSNRPSMSRVVEMLQGSLGSLQIPPRPFLSSPPRSPVDSSSTTVPIMTS